MAGEDMRTHLCVSRYRHISQQKKPKPVEYGKRFLSVGRDTFGNRGIKSAVTKIDRCMELVEKEGETSKYDFFAIKVCVTGNLHQGPGTL